jgi:hypothetical protein
MDFRGPRTPIGWRLAQGLAVLLVVKTTVAVVAGYHAYVPPDFSTDFLVGRQAYFFDGYHLAFYPHVVVGPATLLLGLALLSEAFRRRWPKWHRRLGKLQVALVLFVLAPSGFAMAFFAETGAVAGAGLATLAVATAIATALGWRAAVNRRFAEHRVWMQRSFMLLCSAVVIRLIGGAAEVAGVEGTYPYAAWVSWLAPLIAYEAWQLTRPTSLRRRSSASPAAPPG